MKSSIPASNPMQDEFQSIVKSLGVHKARAFIQSALKHAPQVPEIFFNHMRLKGYPNLGSQEGLSFLQESLPHLG